MVVSIREDIGFDLDRVTDDAFDGKAPGIDLRVNAFDYDALPSISGFLHGFD
jgi:hypothetical protein